MTSDDIVARLRVLNHHAKKLADNESLHDIHRDALTRCENLTWESADKIERLREHVRALEIEIERYRIQCVHGMDLQRLLEVQDKQLECAQKALQILEAANGRDAAPEGCRGGTRSMSGPL